MAKGLDRVSASKYPDANVLYDGFDTVMPRIPENPEQVMERKREFFHSLAPMNYVQAFFADDVALMSIRLERSGRMERRERDRISLHAELFWDDDRALEAEILGEQLAENPTRVSAQLKRTPHGCDWMIQRWEWLREAYAISKAWTEAQMAEAFNLLGRPAHYRSVPLNNNQGLAESEIAKLRGRRTQVEPADKLDRALVLADLSEARTAELRQIRRYENSLHKRLRWNMYQLQIEPAKHKPHPDLISLYELEPEPETKDSPAALPRPKPEPMPVMTPPPRPAPMLRPLQFTEAQIQAMNAEPLDDDDDDFDDEDDIEILDCYDE